MNPDPIAAQVRQQAADWLVELQSDTVDEATRDRWSQWRCAHPDHERAWQRIEAFGERLQAMPAGLARTALDASAGGAKGPRQRRQAIKTLAVLLSAGGLAWSMREHTPWPEWAADSRVGPGQRTRMTLADGTRLDLNAGTALDIRYNGEERLLRLIRGEVLITTAHANGLAVAPGPQDAARPLVVETAHGRVRALGTRFAVRRLAKPAEEGGADASLVSVFEGSVAIRPGAVAGAGLPAPGTDRVLRAGEAVEFDHLSIAPAKASDLATIAWIRGMVVAQDMRLADFVAEMNRQADDPAGRWVCEPAVAGFKVSGTYPLAEPAKVLDMLETALPIRVHRQRRWWGGAQVLLAARPAP